MIYAILVLTAIVIYLAFRMKEIERCMLGGSELIQLLEMDHARLRETVMELEEELADHLDPTS